MKITATVATGKIDSSGERFSSRVLEDVARDAKGKPIKVEFKHTVGHIESAEVIDGSVHVSGVIDRLAPGLYLVPGIKVAAGDIDHDGRTIRHCEITCFGLTPYPADESLTPIEVIDED